MQVSRSCFTPFSIRFARSRAGETVTLPMKKRTTKKTGSKSDIAATPIREFRLLVFICVRQMVFV